MSAASVDWFVAWLRVACHHEAAVAGTGYVEGKEAEEEREDDDAHRPDVGLVRIARRLFIGEPHLRRPIGLSAQAPGALERRLGVEQRHSEHRDVEIEDADSASGIDANVLELEVEVCHAQAVHEDHAAQQLRD